jgi:hypothetical protein
MSEHAAAICDHFADAAWATTGHAVTTLWSLGASVTIYTHLCSSLMFVFRYRIWPAQRGSSGHPNDDGDDDALSHTSSSHVVTCTLESCCAGEELAALLQQASALAVACFTLYVPVTHNLQMRAEEVDELQLQAADCSGTGIAFMCSNWSHLTDTADVCVRVQLIRWLNGCFVGNKENGVSRGGGSGCGSDEHSVHVDDGLVHENVFRTSAT